MPNADEAEAKVDADAGGPAPVTRWLSVRIALLVGVLACEYLLLAVEFDASRLWYSEGAWSGLGMITHLAGFAVTSLAASVALQGRRLLNALQDALADRPGVSVTYALGHATALGLFVTLSYPIFAGTALESAHAMLWFTAWALCGIASTLSWIRATLGPAWLRFAKTASPALALGMAFGGFAIAGSVYSRPWWPLVADQTLVWVRRLMVLVFGQGRVAGVGEIVSLDGFRVAVAPECSGVEGLVVVGLLIGGYLIVRARLLRMPHALLLMPIGMAGAYLFNVVRIVSLVWIGANVSPDVALGGFHSRAGWLAVCVIAVATLWVGERSRFFVRHAREAGQAADNPVLFYCLPLLVSVALHMLTGLAARGALDWLYFVHVCGAGAVLWRYRRRLWALGRPAFGWTTLHGLGVFALWYLLADKGASEGTTELLQELFSASDTRKYAWLGARVLGSVAVVPITEELAFRGFLQRRLIDADFTEVSQERYALLSLVGSALAFGAVHQSLAAGVVAGLAFSGATYVRGRLVDAIWSHAVANAMVAAAVLVRGDWWLW